MNTVNQSFMGVKKAKDMLKFEIDRIQDCKFDGTIKRSKWTMERQEKMRFIIS